jgi:predicted metalloprotease with PDZ domain
MKRTSIFCAAIFTILFLVNAPATHTQVTPAINLTVDATHAPLKILHATLKMDVRPGPLILYYPKWIPGLHEPAGPIANVTGLKFSSNSQSIPWWRDSLDVYTFHVDVPQGASQLSISFDYIEPSGGGGPAAGSATDKLLVLNWNQVLLYPSGTPAAQISFKSKLLLPVGWKFGTALPIANQASGEVNFQAAALDRLIDSPLVAGEYYRAIDLTAPGEPIHHEIDMVADSVEALAMPADVQRGLTNLVAESGKLFGARHYREYHFLLTLSDHTAHFGVEHHESNDSRLPERVFLSPGAAREVGGLLAHEFAHSWSGKFRRPQGECVADFQAPMETDLLWVYEGNTSYLGDVLATRSGMWTPDDYHQNIAGIAASLGPGRPGRTWRPLLDTAVAVPGMFGGAGWGNWRRGSDYYEEGELIWIEVANIIHDQSNGQKSFEDFFRMFYGGPNNGPEVKCYTFDQLVQALNQTVPYDWAKFLNERLTSTATEAPTAGLEAGGWKLVFNAETSGGARGVRGVSITTYTIGLTVGADGSVSDAVYGGPAFKAGIAPGMRVVAVNGRAYRPELLADAIKASKSNSSPIQLLVVSDDYYKTCAIDYHDGERYPHLVRDPARPDYLDEILKPLGAMQ